MKENNMGKNKVKTIPITNGIFLIDSERKILLVHPTNHDEHFWVIPKGMGEEGETSFESASREMLEETNVDIHKLEPVLMYMHLGKRVFKSKRKQLDAHIMIIGAPLSKMNLDLKCDSLFIDDKDGIEYPENDIVKWETLEFAGEYIHESQLHFFNKVEELVAYWLK